MSATSIATTPSAGGFTRKASGLVRDFSQLDAWIYNVLAINIVLNVATLVCADPDHLSAREHVARVCHRRGSSASLRPFVYALFVSAMPRSGGDYVFQSRILGGGIATFFVFTGVTITQIIFIGLAGWLGANLVFGPFLLLLGGQYHEHWLISVGNWFITQWGVFVCGISIALWSAIVNIKGLRLYALLQRYFFWVGFTCMMIIIIGLLATSKAAFISHLNSFVYHGFGTKNVYAATIKAGGTTDTSFTLGATISASVIAAFALIYPAWGVMQAGEIKRANSVSANLRSIVGAEVFSFVFVAIMAALLVSRVGGAVPLCQRLALLQRRSQPAARTAVLRLLRGADGWLGDHDLDRVHPVHRLVGDVDSERATRRDAGDGRDVLRQDPARMGGEGQPADPHPDQRDRGVHGGRARLDRPLLLLLLVRHLHARHPDPGDHRLRGHDDRGDRVSVPQAGDVRSRPESRATRSVRSPVISLCAAVFLVFAVFVDYQALTDKALGINGTHGLIFLGAATRSPP